MKKEDLTAIRMADVITEKALEFSIDYSTMEKIKPNSLFKRLFSKINPKYQSVTKQRKFKVFPLQLGRLQLLSKIYLQLEIDEKAWKEKPEIEIWRVCNEKTDLICRFIAIAVTKDKSDVMNEDYLNEVIEFIKTNCTPQDFVQVMLMILQQIDLVNFTNAMLLMKLLRLNEPKQKKAKSIA
ncbi:MAG: hypothetical protein J6P44_02420 [Bacteroidales bacterium]|nr:hypothetical protein [Bacteroidales bacterium]